MMMRFKAFTELHHQFIFVLPFDELHFILLYLINLFFLLFSVLSQPEQQML